MYIWAIGTLNQLFITGSYTQIKFSKKNEIVSGKNPFVLIGPFYTPHSLCLNITFRQGCFVWKCCVFIRSTLS